MAVSMAIEGDGMTLLDRLLVQAFVNNFRGSEPIFEIGSHQLREGGNPDQDLRSFFCGRKYIGSDFSSGPGVDCVADATRLGVKKGSIGTVDAVRCTVQKSDATGIASIGCADLMTWAAQQGGVGVRN